ncbi:hypothetical protein ACN47E_007192 [Coniothyrium glycines]
MHKILPFDLYNLPELSAATHKVNLVQETKDGERRPIAQDITFQELYDNYVKDGQMLYLAHTLKKTLAENVQRLKEENVPEQARDYGLVAAYTHSVSIPRPQRGKHIGPLKVLPLNLSSPHTFVVMQLDRAYQFIMGGHPVEIRLRLRAAGTKKAEKLKPKSMDDWQWVHNHFPHLRPDVMLKGMPDGTGYSVEPFSDGRHVQWVWMPPGKDAERYEHTKRLLRVKASVRKSIADGRQGELPKELRKRLVASGQDYYTIRSGMPRRAVMKKYGEEGMDSVFSPEQVAEEQAYLEGKGGKSIKSLPVLRWMAHREAEHGPHPERKKSSGKLLRRLARSAAYMVRGKVRKAKPKREDMEYNASGGPELEMRKVISRGRPIEGVLARFRAEAFTRRVEQAEANARRAEEAEADARRAEQEEADARRAEPEEADAKRAEQPEGTS